MGRPQFVRPASMPKGGEALAQLRMCPRPRSSQPPGSVPWERVRPHNMRAVVLTLASFVDLLLLWPVGPNLSYACRMVVRVSGYAALPVDLESMPPGPELGAVLASLDPSLYNGFQLVEILAAQ